MHALVLVQHASCYISTAQHRIKFYAPLDSCHSDSLSIVLIGLFQIDVYLVCQVANLYVYMENLPMIAY